MKQCTLCLLHEVTSHLQVSQVNHNDFTSFLTTLNQHITKRILWVRVQGEMGEIEIHDNHATAGFPSHFPEFDRINREK